MLLRIPKVNTYFKGGLLVLMAKVFLSSSEIMPISDVVDSVLSIVGVFFMFLSAIKKGYKPSAYIAIIVLLVMGMYTSYRIGNLSILLSLAICIAAYRQDKKEIISLLLIFEAGFLLVHTMFAMITSLYGKENFIYISGELQYTLGFGHPNTFSAILVNILLMWSWLNFEKLRVRHFVIQAIIVLINDHFTGTRASIVAIFVFVILYYYVKPKTDRLSMATRCLLPIISAVQLLLNYMYTKQFAYIKGLDLLLSGRIKLGAYWFAHKGITLFGQNLQNHLVTWDNTWKLSGKITFDNMYNYLMMNSGVIWLVILSLFLYRLKGERQVKDNIFIVVWLLYGIVEVHGINPIMMFPLLLITGENIVRVNNG